MKKSNRTTILLVIAAVLLAVVVMSKRISFDNRDIAVIETSIGVIEIELFSEQAPEAVANFLQYVNEGYYGGTVFHRVIPGFIIQAGGFYGNMSWKEGHEPVNIEPNNLTNVAGSVAAAGNNAGVSSHFFINVNDNRRIDGDVPVFGKVIAGMDVAVAISNVENYKRAQPPLNNWPVEEILIKKAYLK